MVELQFPEPRDEQQVAILAHLNVLIQRTISEGGCFSHPTTLSEHLLLFTADSLHMQVTYTLQSLPAATRHRWLADASHALPLHLQGHALAHRWCPIMCEEDSEATRPPGDGVEMENIKKKKLLGSASETLGNY